MKILLTGANGYIAMRLLPLLVEAGHEVTCVVRDQYRFQPSPKLAERIRVIEYDFLLPSYASRIFKGEEYDAAYYLIHSLAEHAQSLKDNEKTAAETFVKVAQQTGVKQIIYLSGIANEEQLSPHLSARKTVKDVFIQSGIPYTIFEAGIIVGSGSASFEIIRDLVEKLPIMIAPKWLETRCQPICIRNVINYLSRCLLMPEAMKRTFEIGGPDILTYKEMLMGYAEVRGYKRHIFIFPVPLPHLSAYFIHLITATNLAIGRQLVRSMKNDVVCRENAVRDIIPQELIGYKEAIRLAFQAIEQNMVVSSWKGAASSSLERLDVNEYIEVPKYGCFRDRKWLEIKEQNIPEVAERFFGIGGHQGWFYADRLWRIRGRLDQIIGGVGLSRGRRSEVDLKPGDALDFWRVLLADRNNYRLLLLAEMKLPGEAWLEFAIVKHNSRSFIKQTATFRPHGVWGRLYWYAMLPFHFFIFRNMIRRIAYGMPGEKKHQ